MQQYQVDNHVPQETASKSVKPTTTVAQSEPGKDVSESEKRASVQMPTPSQNSNSTALIVRPESTSQSEEPKLDPRPKTINWADAMLPFKDAVGRQFMFPFTTCTTWQVGAITNGTPRLISSR